jgi:hypothetical protein
MKSSTQNKRSSGLPLKLILAVLLMIMLPWGLYYNFHTSSSLVKATVFSEQNGPSPYHRSHAEAGGDFDIDTISVIAHERATRKLPVLGEPPTNGTRPMFGRHTGRDAIFALACKYPKIFYVRFVGTLRKFGYADDIVLAVSPPDQMKPGVLEYVQETNVVAYAFDVDCAGKDNCRLRKDFLGSVIFY